MSHFSVLVRVPGDVEEEDLEAAVGRLLLPYKEAGCGDDDPEGLKPYLRFFDTEEEGRKEYLEKTQKMVRLANGEEYSAYDDRFRNRKRGLFEDGPNYVYPESAVEFGRPHRERFSTFEEFMAVWHGNKDRDPETGRYGYWQNPNKKWDWWTVGGRWEELLPQGYQRIGTLYWEALDARAAANLDEFWAEWEAFCDGKEFDLFDGPRDRALALGLLECKDAAELTGKEWKTIPWDKPDTSADKRRNRFDVLKQTTKEWVREHYADAFFPLATWARLDAEHGWVERGKMGWWACADDTPESNKGARRGPAGVAAGGRPE
jgi:hypothetical protein